ncbi:MAG TPA: CtsR family transcriptional regulator [Clostridiales bacterium]|nr:CtsR family transcriptional regulator [Clostridiales bacterium]
MPGTLADAIEAYLLRLIEETERDMLEVSRRELAARFRCVPSQINYVLETRFTPERGFIVRSRRGAGGCIVIAQVTKGDSSDLLRRLYARAGRGLTSSQALDMVRLLRNRGAVSEREAGLIEAALTAVPLPPPSAGGDMVRGRVMKALLAALMA